MPELSDRIEAYLAETPIHGGHSDKVAGVYARQLLQEAMEELRKLDDTICDAIAAQQQTQGNL